MVKMCEFVANGSVLEESLGKCEAYKREFERIFAEHVVTSCGSLVSDLRWHRWEFYVRCCACVR